MTITFGYTLCFLIDAEKGKNPLRECYRIKGGKKYGKF